jgi:serine/threonine protein kinase
LSLEQAIAELKDDVAVLLQNGNTMLNGIDELKALLCKMIDAEDLSGPESQSRASFLKQLLIAANVVSFETGEVLGKGGFCKVRLGLYRHNTKVAVKSILRKELGLLDQDLEAIENEILLMFYIGNHPNILTCYGYCKDETTGDLHIVLEYAPRNSLASILYDLKTYPSLPVRLVLSWLTDLASALEHVHSRKIKHRDVKAENLLVFEDLIVKLCDFGMAKEHCVSKRTTKMTPGTEGFKAPETLVEQGSFYSSDVYSWAMTAYQMFVRKPPVASHSVQQKIDAIMKKLSEDPEVANNKAACEAFRHLLEHCMQLDYKERPSSNHLCNEINRVKQMFGGDLRSFTSITVPSPSMASEVVLNAKIDELQSELGKEKTL